MDYSTLSESHNHAIYSLYVSGRLDDCMERIEEALNVSGNIAEYPIFVKGLILRQKGKVKESLDLFRQATHLNPSNPDNLKQVGRSLFLLGRHKHSLDLYNEAQRLGHNDWEIWHNKGVCNVYLKNYDDAIRCFKRANLMHKHDATFLALGQVYTMAGEYQDAIEVYLEALEFSPENPDILTMLGLLYLRMGENFKAFDFLGNALTLDPTNPKSILAAGSIIQDNQDMDVALIKYRIAAVHTPNSAQLWNNLGMCFFGKKKYVAAISCLKKALYLDPFEWIVAYNLGLVHLHTLQYASAFHYMSASINLKQDFAPAYLYLGIALSHLSDLDNAIGALDKAVELEPTDHLTRLNYGIVLARHDRREEAAKQLQEFETLWSQLDQETKDSDPDILEQRQILKSACA